MYTQRNISSQWIEKDESILPARHHIALLLDLLSEKGVNMNYILRNTGVFYEDLLTQDLLLSPAQFSHLVNNIAKLEQFPDISFDFGNQLIPGGFLSSSHLVIHAPTVGEIIDNLVKYSEIYFPLITLKKRSYNSGIYLFEEEPFGESYSLSKRHAIPYRRWLIEYIFTAIISTTNWRATRELPWRVKVDWNQPSWEEQYDTHWGDIEFEQPMTYLYLDQAYLNFAIPTRSNTLYEVAKKTIPEIPCGLLSFIRNELRQHQNETPSLAQLSDKMNMSPAKLKRLLKTHNSSYRTLLGEVNRQHAIYLQEVQKMDDIQIAKKMKFFDVSNYRRAVRRWS
ncbi:AraC family transcriptional regulator ligand-binding domain-containing protein [Vibrio gangliei]|uniref:AraC family transcriptional regulator ligand-binding domain-containing protein n=1 Tax=Vibrio gangliei TaxID=2077090 RepID=UPI001300402D|nr:AraC family transcriptional regulator ligand-binding domain-containing protein [Vibrio gangliei]